MATRQDSSCEARADTRVSYTKRGLTRHAQACGSAVGATLHDGHGATHPKREAPWPQGPPDLWRPFPYHHDPIAFLEDNAATYGDVSAFRFFHLPVWQLHHPDDVRRVLVDPEGAFTKGIAMEGFRPLVGKGLLLAEGEDHRRQRRLMAPAFHRTALAGYAEEMVSAARREAASWIDGQAVDMDVQMNRLALGVAARTLFGAALSDAEVQDVAEAVSGFVQWYHQSTDPLGPLLQRLPTRATRNFKAGKRRLSTVIARIVAERRQNPGADILSRLLNARDSEGDRATLSPEHLHDEAVTLLIAGHETTGATLAWAWHLMAQHPEIGDRLATEVHAVVGEAPPESQDLPKLAYARWIFAEALRLYPTAIALPRQAQKAVGTRRLYRAERHSADGRDVVCASRRALVGAATGILARALGPGALVRPTKVCVLPVRGGRSHVHRRGVRLD